MITKKRVELYMQRKSRLGDTHEDAESFEDFDDEDMDFTLDGTEGDFDYNATKEEIETAYKHEKIEHTEKHEDEDITYDISLPEIDIGGIDHAAFEQWKKTKGKEIGLNTTDKAELREKVAEEKGLPKKPQAEDFIFKCSGMTPINPVSVTSQAFPALPLMQTSQQDTLYSTDLLSAKDLTLPEITLIVQLALTFKRLRAKGLPTPKLLEDKLVALLFEEPSTRTRCSFEAAAYRLGAKALVVDNAATSSSAKGESISDTARVLSSYSDGIVIRAKKNDVMGRLASQCHCPLVNAGDGSGEHPTQALLDLVTMAESYPGLLDPKRTEPVKVAMIGDIKNSRTIHSLARLLAKVPHVEMIFVAPKALQADSHLLEALKKEGATPVIKEQLDTTCGRADFWYMTRLQTERTAGEDSPSLIEAPYVQISMKSLIEYQAKPSLKIMHPLPRVNELSPEIDNTSHQLYFVQAENGLYTRMAILSLMMADNRNEVGKVTAMFAQ